VIISSDPPASGLEEADEGLAEVELRGRVVDTAMHSQRLDRALQLVAPEFSRSYLQQLIEGAAVRLNGHVATKASHKVKAGDSLELELRPTAQSQAFQPQSIAIDVVYEDAHLVIVNKPPGLVVHPAPGNWSGTLLNALLHRYPGSAVVPRAGIVHRLDKDTSGLMVVARTRAAMDALVAAIAARDVSRQYIALAHRTWTQAHELRVDAAIGRDPRNRLRMAVVDPGQSPGKVARTDFSLIDSVPSACLVKCTLHTGRTHQIRVHMSSIGHPLVADVVYGGAAAWGLERQALHAYRLGFVHPVTLASLAFAAPIPGDLREAISQAGLRYNEKEG